VEDEQGGQDLSSSSRTKAKIGDFARWADELCSEYMKMGVPYHEYWHGDYTQLAYYYKAYEKQLEHENYVAWLQGAYIYDALCAVSPVLHAFAKGGTKPLPYLEEPYKFKEEKDPETVRAEFLARWKANKAKWQSMHGKPSAVERHFLVNGGDVDGADDRRVTS
jgi:hypothetical protein